MRRTSLKKTSCARNGRMLFAGFVMLILGVFVRPAIGQENVVICVIDGARYTESVGAESTYMPFLWENLRKKGALFTNFYNEGRTLTCPGHSTLLTGVWQHIANDGSERPTTPTLFEYFRKQRHAEEKTCYVVAGKPKLAMLTYSTDTSYGARYGASFAAAASVSDAATYDTLVSIMNTYHPRLTIINFPDVDLRGHANDWNGYLHAIRNADSLVYLLWHHIQADSLYKSRTTLFVTNDHGRHDDTHSGFKDHGDECEGCRHIFLLAMGPGMAPGVTVTEHHTQRDIAPAAAAILGISIPHVDGTRSLFPGK